MRAAKLALLLAVLCVAATPALAALRHFGSETELQDFLKKLQHRREVQSAEAPPPSPPPPPPPPAPAAAGNATESVVLVGGAAPQSITNNQEAAVDEGDIVKNHGDVLVILRRGRLFTVSLKDGGLKPIDRIDAYPPSSKGEGWYDEMLVSGDRVVVIGYSYARGGTEVNRFRIDAEGHLKFDDAYQLRSNDYYSSRNYASRLIGHHLIFYTPRYIPTDDPMLALPALRRWNGEDAKFERIGTAREVFLSPGLSDDQIDAIHTIVSCDIAAPVMACKSTSVFGPDGRSFYVSARAVYVWVAPYWGERGSRDRAPAILYRLPLDGGAPSAIGVRGAPVDQFSFREEAADGRINVLVRAEAAGDAMWTAERSAGAVALLSLPSGAFGDGMREAGRWFYRALPKPKLDYDFHNRFAGDYVLYGSGNGWGRPQAMTGELIVAPVKRGPPRILVLPHGVDRIELMGRNAVVVGSDTRNLMFSSVLLGAAPTLGERYTLEGAAQSETRSHGFFFNLDAAQGEDGVLGLPVTRPSRAANRQLVEGAAAVMFLSYRGGTFSGLGELAANEKAAADDHCVASCIDWYGNARPIFLGGRTLALMGYEIVEGRIGDRAIRETGRADFAPK